MCTTCGCGSDEMTIDGGAAHTHTHSDDEAALHTHSHAHVGEDGHDHHPPAARQARTILLERDVLAKNQLLAKRNRGWFAGREVFAVNLMSSPGSGKTSILERTIRDLEGDITISVLEG